MVIDSHHHFWQYTPTEYAWIPEEWSVLRRDFMPADLEMEIKGAGVDRVISVQARQSMEESRWLMDLAARNDFQLGVVGWIPLTTPDVSTQIDSLLTHPASAKLRGFRHVLQGESDPGFMLQKAFQNGISILTRRSLVYDILILEHQLPQAITLVDQHPNQVFVLDHMAKPRIATGELEPWAKHLRELARRSNVACKLSGLVTEADVTAWTPLQLRPYLEHALNVFGPERLLFGSDWPVCLAGVSYRDWKSLTDNALSSLSADERALIMGGNAQRIYQSKHPAITGHSHLGLSSPPMPTLDPA